MSNLLVITPFLPSRKVTFLADSKPLLMYLTYWALVNHCPGDVVYRFVSRATGLRVCCFFC